MQMQPRPRNADEICTNGMVEPKPTHSEKIATQLLESLNSEGEAHIVTDTVLRRWSAFNTPEDIKDCNEVRLVKQEDGKYSCFIGYTTESGRFIDCWGFLGGSESCISEYLKPRL